ncbi:MAG: flagellar hook-basal body protein [Vicinamibacterales bacterium]
MAGGHYVALSGMRTRLDELDRLASDLANVGTAGYKAERTGLRDSRRPQFDAALETAIDATTGGRRLDDRPGAIERTGRDLDLAIEGRGFLVVDTPAGPRYTRNGHLSRQPDGTLVTADGAVVRGADGPLTVGEGRLRIDADGTVSAGDVVAGRLAVVDFADANALVRESGALLRADGGAPLPVEQPVVRTGALEASNVSVVDRVAELTNVSRSFQALQKAVSVLMNDIDGRAVESLSRR